MKIFLAITAYNHQVFDKCSESVTQNIVFLMSKGHEVMPYYHNDLYIDRARNFCSKLFLDSDCDRIVFIDADLKFDFDAIYKLVSQDKDIVAGAYPYKKIALDFPITLDWDKNNNCKEESTGLVYAKRAPTGLMCIKRQVFEKLKDQAIRDEREIYDFFRTGILKTKNNDKNWYGEDTYFCKTWTDLGGKIFIEPNINFKHYGIQEYSGNYHEYLMGRSVEATGFDDVDQGIKGWMSDTELEVLKYLSSKVETVVEIGCWKGRSTKVFLDNCPCVVAVDHWQGTSSDGSSISATLTDVYKDFQKNVGHYENLILLKKDSLSAARDYSPMVDMVFIDAGHTYEECKADIEAWWPKCKKIIAGHDYVLEHPGVKKAVDEKFDNINLIGSVWWVERKGEN